MPIAHPFLLNLSSGLQYNFFLFYALTMILILQIKKASFADENFSISVSKSANEVVATYTKDETGMDLVIHLPPSYPLRSVDVDCTRSLGISEVKQRKWLMSMMSFVRNQVIFGIKFLYYVLSMMCLCSDVRFRGQTHPHAMHVASVNSGDIDTARIRVLVVWIGH